MSQVKMFFGLLLTLAIGLTSGGLVQAHVGSPGVILKRTAGAYQVLISITPPDVVPGTAQVTVWVEQGAVRTVQARPIYFNSGDEGSPVYDDLPTVNGQRNQFKGIVWLMDVGASSINIRLDGATGPANIVVPVVSLATARRTMPLSTSLLLSGLGLTLFFLMVTIVRVCASESLVGPDQPKSVSFRRNQLVATVAAVVVLSVIVVGGRLWWNSRARSYYQQTFYQPPTIEASVSATGSTRNLLIRFDSVLNRRHTIPISFLIPDHGKLMHVFLAQIPNPNVFAHLHPSRLDTLHYQAALPPLPAGRYRLFADVVYRNGFTETMTDTLDIPALAAQSRTKLNPDDSWLIGGPVRSTDRFPRLDASMAPCGVPAARMPLADGSTMLWTDKPTPTLETDRVYRLRFAVADAQGRPAALEPYLGMGGHAVIMQRDGSVYTHLHPVGTYSMAAEASLIGRMADTTRTFQLPDARQFRDSIDQYITDLERLSENERNRRLGAAMPGMIHQPGDSLHVNMVEFPYQFPKPGSYRIWVQVKHKGQILTGVFDTIVESE